MANTGVTDEIGLASRAPELVQDGRRDIGICHVERSPEGGNPSARAVVKCCGTLVRKRFTLVPLFTATQFAGTSCWFATNAVISDIAIFLLEDANVVQSATTTIIQVGFIVGTFLLAATSLVDLVSPKLVFCGSCAIAAFLNALVGLASTLPTLLVLRFVTGICLAGIYPVGMKILASWYVTGLGGALGFLVGALVLGTAFPNLLRAFGMSLPWRSTLYVVSALTMCGGMVVGCVGDTGPHHKRAKKFDPRAVAHLFTNKLFRANAIGYFGHNWEIYTFWAFLPNMITAWSTNAGTWWYGSSELSLQGFSVHLIVFIVIGAGSLGTAGGGLLLGRCGSEILAFGNLFCSCSCCLVSPLVLIYAPREIFFVFLFLWGVFGPGDSPHFSALSARHAAPDIVGSAMTIVVCGGFLCTVISLQAMALAIKFVDARFVFAVMISPGPIIGLFGMRPLLAARTGSPPLLRDPEG